MQIEGQPRSYCKTFVQVAKSWEFCNVYKVPETPEKFIKSKHEAGKLIVLI